MATFPVDWAGLDKGREAREVDVRILGAEATAVLKLQVQDLVHHGQA